MAFGSPPLTGASRNSTPFAAQAAPTFCDTIGLMELMSTRMVPGFAPSSTPPGPSTACSTSGPSGSIVITISERAATSPHDCAARRAIRHHTVGQCGHDVVDHQLWPALSRFLDMGLPMMPRPINPI